MFKGLVAKVSDQNARLSGALNKILEKEADVQAKELLKKEKDAEELGRQKQAQEDAARSKGKGKGKGKFHGCFSYTVMDLPTSSFAPLPTRQFVNGAEPDGFKDSICKKPILFKCELDLKDCMDGDGGMKSFLDRSPNDPLYRMSGRGSEQMATNHAEFTGRLPAPLTGLGASLLAKLIAAERDWVKTPWFYAHRRHDEEVRARIWLSWQHQGGDSRGDKGAHGCPRQARGVRCHHKA